MEPTISWEPVAAVVVLPWFSPFPQEPEITTLLEAAGLEQVGSPSDLPDGCLLLYAPPDQVLHQARASGSPIPGGDSLSADYRLLASLAPGRRLIASWRLQGLDPAGLQAWMTEAQPCPAATTTIPAPDALTALVALSLLEYTSDVLDAYQDLELQAELAATEADTHYLQRLQEASKPDVLFRQWCYLPEPTFGTPDGGTQAAAREIEAVGIALPPDWYRRGYHGCLQEFQSLQFKLHSRQAELQQIQSLADERAALIQSLQRQVSASDQTAQALRSELLLCRENADHAMGQLADMQQEMEALLFSQQQQRQQFSEAQPQLREFQAELGRVQGVSEARAGLIQSLERQLEVSEQGLQQLQDELQTCRQTSAQASEQFTDAQAELRDARELAETRAARVQTLEQSVAAAEQALRHLQAELAVGRTSIDQATQQFAEVQQEMEALLFRHQEQRQQLTASHQQLRVTEAELGELEDLAQKRAVFIQSLQEKVAVADQTIQQLESDLETSRTSGDQAAQQLVDVQLELETLLFSYQEQRRQLTESQQLLRTTQSQLSETQALAEARGELLQDHTQRLGASEEGMQHLGAELESSRHELEMALQQLTQVQAELEDALFANQQLRHRLMEMHQQDVILRGERDDLAQQLRQDVAELELTRSRLQEASSELEGYVLLSRQQGKLLNRQNRLTNKALRLAAEGAPHQG